MSKPSVKEPMAQADTTAADSASWSTSVIKVGGGALSTVQSTAAVSRTLGIYRSPMSMRDFCFDGERYILLMMACLK